MARRPNKPMKPKPGCKEDIERGFAELQEQKELLKAMFPLETDPIGYVYVRQLLGEPI